MSRLPLLPRSSRAAFVVASTALLLGGALSSVRADEEPRVTLDPPTTRAFVANRLPDRPPYVGPLSEKLPFEAFESLGWLVVGFDQRTRYEYRDDYYRAGFASDDQVMLRTRGYLGIQDVLDPLRMTVEFQDSQVLDSEFPENTRDTNEADILQLFGELRFEDLFGAHEPLSLRFGRMSFDAVDGRLLARNRYPNTTNAFDGLRARIGEDDSLWEVDALLARPTERFLRAADHADDERVFGGVSAYYRGFGEWIVVEPYWFVLDEARKAPGRPDRHLHTVGLHTNGLFGGSGFDHDVDIALQVGESGGLDHLAAAAHAEVGYTFDGPWRPRLATFVNFATGDGDPGDGTQNLFDPLFGAAHGFYGFTDFFHLENFLSPAVHLDVRPLEGLRVEGIWRGIWLASERDAWVRAGLVDPTGASGGYVGHEIDLRLIYRACRHFDLEVGYAHFTPGTFVERVSPISEDAEMVYVAARAQF